MSDEYKSGSGSFWVQFSCGAALGVLVGIGLWREFASSWVTGVLILLGSTGVCSLIAGFWGDKFWEALIRIFGWTGRR